MVLCAGCSTMTPDARTPPEVRSVFVQEPEGADSDELRRYGEVAHDLAVRRLEALGYVAARDPADADATLEGRWVRLPAGGAAASRRLTLRLALRSRTGRLLFEAQVIPETPVHFVSADRIRDALSSRLAELGPAPCRR